MHLSLLVFLFVAWVTVVHGLDCGALTDPTNGKVDTSAGTSPGDMATYTCDKGYELNGAASVTCQGTGQWNDSAPTCEPNCGALTDPTNGKVDTSAGTSPGDMATYTCDKGYEMNGAASVTCQGTGQWSDSAPTCEPKCPRSHPVLISKSCKSCGGQNRICILGLGDLNFCCSENKCPGTHPIVISKSCDKTCTGRWKHCVDEVCCFRPVPKCPRSYPTLVSKSCGKCTGRHRVCFEGVCCTNGQGPCYRDDGHCSHICINVDINTVKCECPTGFELTMNKKTCRKIL